MMENRSGKRQTETTQDRTLFFLANLLFFFSFFLPCLVEMMFSIQDTNETQ